MIPDTIAALSAAYASRTISPVEVTQAALRRIEALDPAVHAFITVTPERALADARASEARMMHGGGLGPLDGVPIAHKDNFDTAGIRSTASSAAFAERVPTQDAAVVRHLAASGGVLLGKLACYESAFAGPSFDLPWPPPVNPWDAGRATSGSSSGSAVAVAAGLVLGATGSDTGGSIRDPAANCGIAGLKPTFGLLDTTGLFPFATSMDHAGPMAHTAEDCALLLDGMVPVPGGWHQRSAGSVRGLRIGTMPAFLEEVTPSAPVLAAYRQAIAVLRDLGATVTEISLPSLAEFSACCWPIACAELHEAHAVMLRQDGGRQYGTLLRVGLDVGAGIPATAYISALRRRGELAARVREAMARTDLLLLPAHDSEPAEIATILGALPFEKPTFTAPFNVTGQPAIAVSAGAGDSGLPVSVQMVGRPFDEATVLTAARCYESVVGGHRQRPRLDSEPGRR